MVQKKPTPKKGKSIKDKKKGEVWVQPAFDPRIYTLKFGLDKNNDLSSSLRRGAIKQIKAAAGLSGPAQLNFLYNPSQVGASYALNSTDVQAAALVPQPGDDAAILTPLSQSISFSLLFDRTYELWDSSKKSTSAGTYGVMVDVWAMQQLVGMNASVTASPGSSADASKIGTEGVMQTTFCDFYFGGRDSLNFFGSIQSWDVTYTHWTQLMVPMRCVMNVTAQLYPADTRKSLLGGDKKKAKYEAPNWSKIPTSNHGLPGGMSNTTGVMGR